MDFGDRLAKWLLILAGLVFAGRVIFTGQTRIAPDQLRAPRPILMSCAGITSPASSCDGLYYVELTQADGSKLKIVGAAAPAGFVLDPARWQLVILP